MSGETLIALLRRLIVLRDLRKLLRNQLIPRRAGTTHCVFSGVACCANHDPGGRLSTVSIGRPLSPKSGDFEAALNGSATRDRSEDR